MRPKPRKQMLRLRAGDFRCAVSQLCLSPQQAKVVALLLEGKQDKQIAAAMKLRVSTLRTYFSRIFERTGAADRVGLVLKVFECVYDRNAGSRVIRMNDNGNDGLFRRRRMRD